MVTSTEYLILDCLEEIIEHTLHLFRDIGPVILGLESLACFRGN